MLAGRDPGHTVRYEVTPTDSADVTMSAMLDHAFEAANLTEKSFDATPRRLEQWRTFLNVFQIGDLARISHRAGWVWDFRSCRAGVAVDGRDLWAIGGLAMSGFSVHGGFWGRTARSGRTPAVARLRLVHKSDSAGQNSVSSAGESGVCRRGWRRPVGRCDGTGNSATSTPTPCGT